MFAAHVVKAWGRILSGRAPSMSIELTRECPLRCPGCYAYGDEHLGGGITLRDVRDLRGQELIDGVLALVARHRPLHLSIVGGEPLVRYRELDELLPRIAALGVHTQLVTSAVRPIPASWASVPNLSLTVSIDGLQPEHDRRRAPATYDRILTHIAGHRVTVHCTVTRQQSRREGYLEEFLQFWTPRLEIKKVWFSLYTPQIGEISEEKLRPADRERIVAELHVLRKRYPKLDMREGAVDSYLRMPEDPSRCTFARTTACFAPDLERPITPCQLGGHPDCANCGCIASAALEAVSRHRLVGIPLGRILDVSSKIGSAVAGRRAARPSRIGAAGEPMASPE
jgi:MoaA/NifB/PqqE/SkfB family radical SAM enzyme